MNWFRWFFRGPFKWILGLFGEIFQSAKEAGIFEALVKIALEVALAQARASLTNDEKRENGVADLRVRAKSAGIVAGESLARLALEAAVSKLKKDGLI